MALHFDHFTVLEDRDGTPILLGQGGMGKTYKARDMRLQRLVALKVIADALLDNEEARVRFFREAQMATRIKHPNVASVLHLCAESARPCFYAMEFVDGTTLGHYLHSRGRLSPVMAMQVAYFVGQALEAASHEGVIHRDLKPENIMLVEAADGEFEVKLIDFGLARPMQSVSTEGTQHSGFVGTVAYASPEQISADDSLDVRSDLYSLAVTLWQLTTGQLPFAGNFIAIMQQHLDAEPPRRHIEHLPEIVQEFLLRLLAKDREERPRSAQALLEEIRRVLAGLGAQPPRAVVVRPRRERDVVDHDGRGDHYLPLPDSATTEHDPISVVRGQRSGRRAVLRRLPGIRNMKLDTAMRADAKRVQANADASLLRVIDVQSAGIICEHSGGISLPRLLALWHGDLEPSTVFAWMSSMAQAIDWSVKLGIKGLSASVENWHVDFGGTLDPDESATLPPDDGPLGRIRLDPLGGYDAILAQVIRPDGTAPAEQLPELRLDANRALRQFAATMREMLGGGRKDDDTAPIAGIGVEANEVLLDAIAGKYDGWSALQFVWHLLRKLTASAAAVVQKRPREERGTPDETPEESEPVKPAPVEVPPPPPVNVEESNPGHFSSVLREWSKRTAQTPEQLPRLAIEKKLRVMLGRRVESPRSHRAADPSTASVWGDSEEEPNPITTFRPVLAPAAIASTDAPTHGLSPITTAGFPSAEALADDAMATVVGFGAGAATPRTDKVEPEEPAPVAVKQPVEEPVTALRRRTESGRVQPSPWQRYKAALVPIAALLLVAGALAIFWSRKEQSPIAEGGNGEVPSEPSTPAPATPPPEDPAKLVAAAKNAALFDQNRTAFDVFLREAAAAQEAGTSPAIWLGSARARLAQMKEHANDDANAKAAVADAQDRLAASEKAGALVPVKVAPHAPSTPPMIAATTPPPATPPPLRVATPPPVVPSTPPPVVPVVTTPVIPVVPSSAEIAQLVEEGRKQIAIIRVEAPKTTPALDAITAFKMVQDRLTILSKSEADILAKERKQAEPIVNSLGMVFVSVPGEAARFSIWETRWQDFKKFSEENLKRRKPYKFQVRRNPFIPAKITKSNADAETLENFIEKPKSERAEKAKEEREGYWKNPNFAQQPNEPVVCVSWDDARAFCDWLSEVEKKDGHKYRLPTDKEWSAAAGGEDFPWGDEIPVPNDAGNYFGSEGMTGPIPQGKKAIQGFSDPYPRTAPVGKFRRNRQGIYDLGGNVQEWCGDNYLKEMNQGFADVDSNWKNEIYKGEPYKPLRGGSWFSSAQWSLKTAYRDKGFHDTRSADWGFRCVLELEAHP